MRKEAILLMLILIPAFCVSCSKRVNDRRVPETTLKILEEKFQMSVMLEMLRHKQSRESLKFYLDGESSRYKYITTERQEDMIVYAYSVLDPRSPILGYSVFFNQDSETLVFIDASVNPLNAVAEDTMARLIDKSFDSVASVNDSKLHYLGKYSLDDQSKLKIMIQDANISSGKAYAVRYAISIKQN